MKKLLLSSVLAMLVSPVAAFEISGQKWPGAGTPFYIDIEGSSATDITWNAAFIGALEEWNRSTDFSFELINEYRNPCADDSVNSVDFTDDVCGMEYGANTLAITLSQSFFQVLGPPYLAESDIVVNRATDFDIFDGNLTQSGAGFAATDFRRVVLHELGHVIGLDHESSVSAIMAPIIGNLDRLTEDDIAGVNTLYGGLSRCIVRPLVFGQSSDSLSDGDCTVAELTVGGDDTSFIDVYRFDLSATTTLEFSMTSPVLDSVLVLADSNLNYLVFDDNSSGACDASLRQELEPGSYLLLANTYVVPPIEQCGNTGAYSLNAGFSSAELLQLGDSVSLQGGVSTAIFSGGVTADDGLTWGNRFRSTDSLDIKARIEIDPAHQDQAGSLVVAAVLEGQIFLLNQQGQFVDANQGSGTIIRAARRVLTAVEELDIITDLVFAALGVESITVDFLVGYGLDSDPAEIYFHPTPINLTVDP